MSRGASYPSFVQLDREKTHLLNRDGHIYGKCLAMIISLTLINPLVDRGLAPVSRSAGIPRHSRSLPNGGIGKERLNRRFLISSYGFHPAPWAGSTPRRVRRRFPSSPPCAVETFFETRYMYLGAEARHYTHVTQKLLFFCRGPEL